MATKKMIKNQTITIVVKETDGMCQVDPEECNTRPGDKVRWYGSQTEACILFANAKWPFEGAHWPKIEVPVDNYSHEFTVKSVTHKFAGDYQPRCRPCHSVQGKVGPGGAKIIIDP